MSSSRKKRLLKLAEDGLLSEQEQAELHRLLVRENRCVETAVTPFKVRNSNVAQDLQNNHGFLWAGVSNGTFPVCKRYRGSTQICAEIQEPCPLLQCKKEFEFTKLLPPPGMSKKKAKIILNQVLKKWQK